jgi:hypothetical protein
MSKIAYNPKLQKRFWSGTVWIKHADAELAAEEFPHDEDVMDAYRKWWAELAANPGVQFAEAQIEVGANDNLHIQVAVKTVDSKRWEWMIRHLPAHWEPAINWGALQNYVKKTSDRIEYLGVVGTRPKTKKTVGHGLAKQRALRALRDGKTPTWIAVHDADAYFTHWRAIHNYYERLCTPEAMQEIESMMRGKEEEE